MVCQLELVFFPRWRDSRANPASAGAVRFRVTRRGRGTRCFAQETVTSSINSPPDYENQPMPLLFRSVQRDDLATGHVARLAGQPGQSRHEHGDGAAGLLAGGQPVVSSARNNAARPIATVNPLVA